MQARGIRNSQTPTKAKLTYFQDQYLKLELQYKSEDEWTTCFEVPNFKVPPVAYLGFRAETGELTDNHDIITVRSHNLYKKNPGGAAPQSTTDGKKGKKTSSTTREGGSSTGGSSTGGGWTWFFMKFVFFGLALTGAYVGYTMYRTRQRDRF
jgi:mannose-binding lectin 2